MSVEPDDPYPPVMTAEEAGASPTVSSTWIGQAWGYHAAALTAGAISIASTPFVARILTPEAYGVSDSQIQLAGAVSIFATLGLDSAIGRAFLDEKDQARRKGYVTLGLRRLLLAGGMAGLLLGGVFRALMPDQASSSLIAVGIAAAVPLAMAESFLRNVARWRFDLRGYSFLLVLSAGVKAILGVVLCGLWGGPGLVAAYVAGAAFSVVAGVIRNRSFIGPGVPPEASPLYRYGAPLMLASFAATFGVSAERWLALTLVSAADLGQLVGATKIAGLYVIVAEGLRQSWSPAAFSAWREPAFAVQYSEALGKMSILLGWMVGGLGIFAPEIATLALGRTFAPAAALVPFLALAYGLQDMGRYLSIGLHRSMRGATQAAIAWGSTATWILLAAAVAPRFGIAGFAAAGALAALVALLVNGILSHRELPLVYPTSRFLLAAACAATGFFFAGAPLVPKLVGASLMTLALLPMFLRREAK